MLIVSILCIFVIYYFNEIIYESIKKDFRIS